MASQTAFQNQTDGFENFVAEKMSVVVIDYLEKIDVQHDQAKGRIISHTAFDFTV